MTADSSNLFDSTSRKAGERAARSASLRYKQILDHLQEHGPSTLFEVAAAIGVYDHQISGRFTALSKDGVIERTGQRRVKPETGCEADVWRIAEQQPRAPELADRLGYPQSINIGGDNFDRGVVLEKDEAPGLPYVRRAGGGGVRLNYRVELVECGGCGRPLKLVQEAGEKKYRCGSPGCNRTWYLQLVNEPGQPQLLALVMRHL